MGDPFFPLAFDSAFTVLEEWERKHLACSFRRLAEMYLVSYAGRMPTNATWKVALPLRYL